MKRKSETQRNIEFQHIGHKVSTKPWFAETYSTKIDTGSWVACFFMLSMKLQLEGEFAYPSIKSGRR